MKVHQAVLLVGGFGSSKYMFKRLDRYFVHRLEIARDRDPISGIQVHRA